jgi:MFS transporter, DHA1 family, multidrug resistance protein
LFLQLRFVQNSWATFAAQLVAAVKSHGLQPFRPKTRAAESRYVVLLSLLLGSQPVATDLYLPALPAIASELGNPALTLTGLMLAFGFAQLIIGPLSDRFGRRPLLLIGCAAYALTSFAGAWVTTLPGLIVCRGLQGAAMAALVVCARASVRDLYPPVDGMRMLSRGLSGLGVVALASPLIGALLVAYFSWHATFIAIGVFAVVAGLWVWFYYQESRPISSVGVAPESYARATRAVLASPRFRAWTAVLMASYGTLFCFLLSSGFVYIQVFTFSPLQCGFALASNGVAYIAGTYLCRWLLRRCTPVRTVRFGACFTLAGAAFAMGVAWLAGPQAWAMIAGQSLVALAHGVNQPCGQAGAIGDFPQHAGQAAALSGFAMMVTAFACGQLMAPSLGESAWPLLISNMVGSIAIAFATWVLVPRAYAEIIVRAKG